MKVSTERINVKVLLEIIRKMLMESIDNGIDGVSMKSIKCGFNGVVNEAIIDDDLGCGELAIKTSSNEYFINGND